MKLKELRKFLKPESKVYDKKGNYISMVKNMTSSFDDCEVESLYDGIYVDTSGLPVENAVSEVKPSSNIKLIKPWVKFIDPIDGKKILERIERCGRICWQSEPKGNPEGFVRNLIKRGHTSVLEHVNITFEVMTDIATLIDWTRHRHASYSVESTRFVKYTDGMEFIEPIDITDEEQLEHFFRACEATAEEYQWMLNHGMRSDQGRTIINKSLRCNFVCTMNLRSLRNFFQLRCAKDVNPHFKQLTIPMLMYLKNKIPVVFDDITYDEAFYRKHIEGRIDKYITCDMVDETVNESAESKNSFYRVKLDYKYKPSVIVDKIIYRLVNIGTGESHVNTPDLHTTTDSVSCVVSAKDEEEAKMVGFRYLYSNSEKTGVWLFKYEDIKNGLYPYKDTRTQKTLIGVSDGVFFYRCLEGFNPGTVEPELGNENWICCIREGMNSCADIMEGYRDEEKKESE